MTAQSRAPRPGATTLHAFDVVAGGEAHYVEQFRTADLSVGTYAIPEGGEDPQSPHTEDEVYIVVSGAAVLTTAEGDLPASVGAVLVVPAGVAHRFVNVQKDFRVVVVFAPPERTRAQE